MSTVQIVENTHEVAAAAAKDAIENLRTAINTYGEAVWVLAGGTIPPIAAALIASQHSKELDWSKVTFLIGDERCVPLDHHDSSWIAFDQDFFPRLPDIDPSRLLRPSSDLSAEEAAQQYEVTIRSLAKNSAGHPRFDLVWLGVGDDGHTLSLFPNHESSMPSERLVIPVHNSPKPPPDRISLTYAALAGTVACTIIAAGEGKASVIKQSLDGNMWLPVTKAVATIEASGGKVAWLLDRSAASRL